MVMYITIQKKIDDEISTSNRLSPWDILSPIACWTWWWPPSRPKHVVQLKTLLQITTCCVLTSLHYTLMLYTQRGCLNSKMIYTVRMNKDVRTKPYHTESKVCNGIAAPMGRK